MHFTEVYIHAEDGPQGDFGYFQPPEAPECPVPPCPVSSAGTAWLVIWFGGSLAAAHAAPLSPPAAVRLDQAGGCEERWTRLVRGSSACTEWPRCAAAEAQFHPPTPIPGDASPGDRVRNRAGSCPAGTPAAHPIAPMKKQFCCVKQPANQTLACKCAHSGQDCAR